MSAAERRESFASRRLRSLWEMYQFQTDLFYRLSRLLGKWREGIELEVSKSKNRLLIRKNNDDLRTIETYIEYCSLISEVCTEINATFSLFALKRFAEKLNEEDSIPLVYIAQAFGDLDQRLRDELSSMCILMLTSEETQLYSPEKELFGKDFALKFKTDGVFELDEAAKCLAVGRPTASVFHLMRVMEIGVRALARSLAIPDPLKPAERNWGKVLDQIRKGIESKWPDAMARSKGDGALFEDLHASLDAVKNPWRNSTMHVEKKYTEDEARHIFWAVKGFMGKLAFRMDETGHPSA